MRKALIFAAAAVVTAAILATALSLGSWAFHRRQTGLHVDRLKNALAKHPTGPQLEAALAAEGGRLVDQAASPEELRRVAERWAPGEEGTVVAQGSRFARTRVVVVGGMVYFLYFDAEDHLRDFQLRPMK
jgi:hypothetical protein